MLPRVTVLMATYNGEDYVREQITSILNQEEVSLTLYITDDGSTDNTRAILNEFKDNSNIIVHFNQNNVGIFANYMGMLYALDTSNTDYIAFSDQDDIWCENKLAHAVRKIKEVDKGNTPILYYSEINNFCTGGKVKRHEIGLYRDADSYPLTMLFSNWAYGCTMVMNREMAQLASKHHVKSCGRLHDAWIHSIALYCGATVVRDFDTALIHRRIHENNSAGAMELGFFDLVKSVSRLSSGTHHPVSQAAATLLDAYSGEMDDAICKKLGLVAGYRSGLNNKIKLIRQGEIYCPSCANKIKVIAKILLGRY